MSDMMEKLLVLQERDTRIRRLRRDLDGIPREIQMLEDALERGRSTLENARIGSMEAESERKRLELEVQSMREKVAKYQSQQLQIKSNEEYRALTSEIATLRRRIEEVEERELAVMERIEELANEFRQAEISWKEVESDAEQRREQVALKESSLKERLGKLATERESAAAECDAGLLKQYTRILLKKNDVAIVAVENGSCGGCHLKLPPQTINLASRGDRLIPCDHCGRIVYARPE